MWTFILPYKPPIGCKSMVVISTEITQEDVTVVLSALNEEEGIGNVLDQLRDCGYTNILVIDGYSRDSTVKIAESRGVKVVEQHWGGKTGAVKTALDYINTPYVAFLDADGTYPPDELYRLLAHAQKYVEVIGKRDRKNIGSVHRLGNLVINKIFSLVFSADVGDVLSGMYVLNTEVAKTLNLDSDGFEVEVEIASQMLQKGKVTYVPIRYDKRHGTGKLSSFKDGFKITSYILKMAKDHNPILFYSLIVTGFSVPGAGLLAYTLADYALRGVFHSGYALMGITLLLIGIQGLMTMGISSLIKRLEYAVLRK
ncbi:hypothetical protein HS7_15090 [Sulfolobales archaeon HS-7]|nr:hypothetical protein HS7_15090 [Sulfolobales archaeon HS-7]